MNKTTTSRGFLLYSFKDCYGDNCSLQKSSSANEDRIWLGVEDSRMHLSQQQVKKLIPLLTVFVNTGELFEEEIE
jgi:hypothetical protein